MSAALQSAREYHLLLPPGWLRLPIDDRAFERVALLVSQRVAQLPVEHREQARTTLTRLLTEAIRNAEDASGIDVLIAADQVVGVPVTASCVVAHVSRNGLSTPALVAELTEAHAGVRMVSIGGGDAVRQRLRRRVFEDGRVELLAPEPLDQPSPPAADEGASIVEDSLRFFVPMPGSEDLLLFSFTTVQPMLVQALLSLFDAMMSTLRWVR